MKKLVVLTGAGISKESGIATYRDADGLWNKYDPAVYANIRTWRSDPDKMNEFYNLRRQELANVQPNSAHLKLVDLEKDFEVTIITQNVDDLHEKAGSKNILHIHGELRKIRKDQDPIYNLAGDTSQWIDIGNEILDLKEKPDYRPAVVFFGEAVPAMTQAVDIVQEADILVIIGTSLQVYPAASLLDCVNDIPIYYIDPSDSTIDSVVYIKHIKQSATVRMEELIKYIYSNDK